MIAAILSIQGSDDMPLNPRIKKVLVIGSGPDRDRAGGGI